MEFLAITHLTTSTVNQHVRLACQNTIDTQTKALRGFARVPYLLSETAGSTMDTKQDLHQGDWP